MSRGFLKILEKNAKKNTIFLYFCVAKAEFFASIA